MLHLLLKWFQHWDVPVYLWRACWLDKRKRQHVILWRYWKRSKRHWGSSQETYSQYNIVSIDFLNVLIGFYENMISYSLTFELCWLELLALALFKLIPDLSYSEFGERISSSGRQNEKNELLSRLVSYTPSKIVKFYTDQSLFIPRIYIWFIFLYSDWQSEIILSRWEKLCWPETKRITRSVEFFAGTWLL